MPVTVIAPKSLNTSRVTTTHSRGASAVRVLASHGCASGPAVYRWWSQPVSRLASWSIIDVFAVFFHANRT